MLLLNTSISDTYWKVKKFFFVFIMHFFFFVNPQHHRLIEGHTDDTVFIQSIVQPDVFFLFSW